MIKKFLLPIVLLGLFLSSCRGAPATVAATETPAPTVTPDPCSEANLPSEVAKVNKLMREFDDYSALASNTPQQQLVAIIPELQRVLREAEDQVVPACLNDLKALQLKHMGTVVQTLMAFMSSSDANLVSSGIAQARDLHTQYDTEMARLLGITMVPVPTNTTAPVQPNETPQANETQPPVTATNLGPISVNLRNAPDINAGEIATLDSQKSTLALGRTEDSQWVLVEVPGQPGQKGWVSAPLVQISVPVEQLPVVTP
jgi:hypothetical protein